MERDDSVNNPLAMLSGEGWSTVEEKPVPQDPLPGELIVSMESALRPSPWSKSEVMERLGEDETLLREMCGIFLSESAHLLEKLRQAVAGGEADTIMRAAHSLKGEVSYLSAPAATEAARRLEDMGHEHDIARAPEALASLEREMERLCRSIREFTGVEP